ncbi:hypothetical protein G5I_06265 [Acromyrmex echinatior]|uniref:DDE Tnp4 domain-containing protein n=1 Tax=Acromyrmex echinatior TaxID=103372 RepID=F4WKK1_ACREC|nr:hypothetical protein G5I_06265 [Acromyrmex echinatior]
MTKEQFRELLQYCDPIPEPNGHRYVYEKDLLAFLCKLRQGLCDDFLRVLFNYQSRQAVSLAVATILKITTLQCYETSSKQMQQGQRQLDTAEANDSRLVTKSRWIIEARNSHIKSIFKFFKNTISVVHAINLRAFYLIAGAIINRYRDVILMDGATAELAEQMLQKARSENTLRLRVETEHLARRNAMWNRLNENQILDFPRLDIDFLKELTVGIYQIRLAPAYIQDKLVRDESEVFELDEHRNEANFLKVWVYSRFRNATKHQLWIAYRPHGDENNEPITVITVLVYQVHKHWVHVLMLQVFSFLGYARHQPNTKYPSVTLLNHIKDAANRYNQDEEIEGEVIEPF